MQTQLYCTYSSPFIATRAAVLQMWCTDCKWSTILLNSKMSFGLSLSRYITCLQCTPLQPRLTCVRLKITQNYSQVCWLPRWRVNDDSTTIPNHDCKSTLIPQAIYVTTAAAVYVFSDWSSALITDNLSNDLACGSIFLKIWFILYKYFLYNTRILICSLICLLFQKTSNM